MFNFKYKTLIFSFIIFFFCLPGVMAQGEKVEVHFFWGTGCPHCVKVEELLTELKTEYENININSYEIYSNSTNREKFNEMMLAIGEEAMYVPTVIIGSDVVVGFSSPQTRATMISLIEKYSLTGAESELPNQGEELPGSLDPMEPGLEETPILDEEPDLPLPNNGEIIEDNEFANIVTEIDVPFFGRLNLADLSLPLITIIFGILDGFNPCAMWVLLFLISVLIGLKDRKKMWVLGFTFLLTSALIYFLFMVAWLELILILGVLFWLRIVIASIALIGGSLNLKAYFSTGGSGCKVVSEQKRIKIFNQIKKVTKENSMFLALIGIVMLAISVNLIELICSAGFPVIYTQILAVNELSKSMYYLYLLLYIIFFLLDDIIVFVIAMYTLKLTGLSTKYTRFANLIGGFLMILIGILLIVKPELLMFG